VAGVGETGKSLVALSGGAVLRQETLQKEAPSTEKGQTEIILTAGGSVQ
jgi:hypothetical protein